MVARQRHNNNSNWDGARLRRPDDDGRGDGVMALRRVCSLVPARQRSGPFSTRSGYLWANLICRASIGTSSKLSSSCVVAVVVMVTLLAPPRVARLRLVAAKGLRF